MDKNIHTQMVSELQAFRKMDKKLGAEKFEITKDNILNEMNKRYTGYSSHYSFDFKILQTVQDFCNFITPLQIFTKKQPMVKRLDKAKVDFSIPVASLKSGKLIYVLENINDNGELFIIK